jgi:hypothetical protein
VPLSSSPFFFFFFLLLLLGCLFSRYIPHCHGDLDHGINTIQIYSLLMTINSGKYIYLSLGHGREMMDSGYELGMITCSFNTDIVFFTACARFAPFIIGAVSRHLVHGDCLFCRQCGFITWRVPSLAVSLSGCGLALSTRLCLYVFNLKVACCALFVRAFCRAICNRWCGVSSGLPWAAFASPCSLLYSTGRAATLFGYVDRLVHLRLHAS